MDFYPFWVKFSQKVALFRDLGEMIDQPTLAAIRFGYGLPLPKGAVTDPAGMLRSLREPDGAMLDFPAAGLADIMPMLQDANAARKKRRKNPDDGDFFVVRKEARQVTSQSLRSGFGRALEAKDGFRERLVTFWADHFCTKSRNAIEGALPWVMIDEAIRPNVSGRFGDMLVAATLHPAMLVYLDQVASIGPDSAVGKRRGRGLNENLAREVMELHSLGVNANYSQSDVREMAELLTGLDANADEGFLFHENWAQPGPETVLGKTYSGKGVTPIKEALQDLARRPETAKHISWKLAVHFVSDKPPAELIEAMTAAYSEQGGDLFAVYTAMLNHPAAWEPRMTKARQPYDFIVASLRALGVSGAAVMEMRGPILSRMLLRPMSLMGQSWRNPNGPDGWPEAAENWITPQGLAIRIRWGMEVPGRLVTPMPDPREFALHALGAAADEQLLWAVDRAESQREGVGLVFASPAFNRR
jgi:uncharacterized protein (DUF1800 family)